MKNPTLRLIALLLALCMVLPLAACGDTGEDDADTGENTETETEEAFPNVKKTDYGKEFAAIYCGDIFREGYYFNKEAGRDVGNDLDDRIYERVERIKDYLGVTVTPVAGGNYLEYSEKVKNAVNAGDDAYQLVMTHVYMDVATMITGNYFLNMDDLASCDYTAPYWNSTLMDQLAVNEKHYVGYNDFCLSNCYVIAFNKGITERYAEMDNVYDLVRNKEWTLQKLMDLSALVSADSNGDGKMDHNDSYGFAGLAWVPMISFVTGCGMPIIDKDEDDALYVTLDKENLERFTDLTERMLDFYKADCTFMWPHTQAAGETINLASGRLLFEMTNNFSLIGYKEEDLKLGVLPYPLYDNQQENYQTLNWNGVLGVPSTTASGDPAMVSDVMEMLAYFSGPVKTAFYETLLGARIADAPEDVEMLNIIWSTQVSDIGLIFSSASGSMDALLYALPSMVTAGNANVASKLKSNVKTAEKALANMFKEKKTKK